MTRHIRDLLIGAISLVLVVVSALMAVGALPYRLYVVHTGSMEPTIRPNSAVIVKEGVYHVGQPITFATPDGLVTHRLIGLRLDGSLVTKGDANTTADPGFIPPSSVVGGVVVSVPFLGYVLTFLKNPAGMGSALAGIIALWLTVTLADQRSRRQASRV